MKQVLFLAAVAATMSMSVNASVFTMGDIIKVSPADRGNTITIEACAHFDRPFDAWDISLEYADGIEGLAAGQLEGAYLNRVNESGCPEQYIVPLHFNADVTSIICETMVSTYKQVNGRWVPDYRVYWPSGDYRMFELVVYIAPDFDEGDILMNCIMSRRNQYSEESQTTTHLVLANDPGDVNGDGELSIADVTALIDYLLGGKNSQFNEDVADVDTDGEVAISDVTALINIMQQ